MSAYDLRIYEVAEGEIETLEAVLRELALPLMPEHGMQPVGFWSDRRENKLYQISRHADGDAVEANWDRFHADPRWADGLEAHRGDRTVVRSVTTKILAGIAGTPPAYTNMC